MWKNLITFNIINAIFNAIFKTINVKIRLAKTIENLEEEIALAKLKINDEKLKLAWNSFKNELHKIQQSYSVLQNSDLLDRFEIISCRYGT